MQTIEGKTVVPGNAEGPALVTRQPINFTASFSKPINLIPSRRSQITDRHHGLFGEKIQGKVLVFPAAIGSTYTGAMLLELMYKGRAPKALVVQCADSLLVSGSILANAWFNCGTPIIECARDDLFDLIPPNSRVQIDGEAGHIILP